MSDVVVPHVHVWLAVDAAVSYFLGYPVFVVRYLCQADGCESEHLEQLRGCEI